MTDKTTVDNKFTFKTESTLAIYLQIPSFKRFVYIFDGKTFYYQN